jgi:hypothetical protein
MTAAVCAAVLRCLRGNPDAAQLSKAQKLYKQLAAELSCHPDSAQLEPLRSYLHLKVRMHALSG